VVCKLTADHSLTWVVDLYGMTGMTLQEIMGLRYCFYKTALFFMTRHCPLRCRHCAVEAGPDLHETVPINEVRPWLRDMEKARAVELIAISGGEPFAKPAVLWEMLKEARDCGFRTVVITSGFWATSIDRARKILRSMPPISALEISADQFHEEWVPTERIRHAAVAALEEGTAVIIGTADYNGSYKEKASSILGDCLLEQVEFLENDVHAVGRALRNRLVPYDLSDDLPGGGCGALCAPVIRYDGNVLACCQNEIVYEDDHALWLGNMNREKFRDIYERANTHYLIQALRTVGPKGIVELAQEHHWDWKPRRYKNGNICDLCRDIIASPQLLRSFEAFAGEDEAFQHQIAVSRFLKYAEVVPV
jgi:organic radical activating enzyme